MFSTTQISKTETGSEYISLVGSLIPKKLENTSGAGNTFVVVILA